jgi:transposase
MGLITQDDGWRIPDELWDLMRPHIPRVETEHPLGCHRGRVPDRNVMNAILFVLRTGCQWKALDGTALASGSTAHRRFLEWVEAGVFLEFWKAGLLEYDAVVGIDWRWLSMDGAMTKAPLGGKKNGPEPYRPRQKGHKAKPADRRKRDPALGRSGWGQPARQQARA